MFFRKKAGLTTSTTGTDKSCNRNAKRLGPGTGLTIKSLAKTGGKKNAASNQSQSPLSSGESIDAQFDARLSPPLSPVHNVPLAPSGVGQRQHVSPFIRLNQAVTRSVDSSAGLTVVPDNSSPSSGPEISMIRASTLPAHSSEPPTPHAHESPRLMTSVTYHGSGASCATSVPGHINLPSQPPSQFNLFTSGVTSSTTVNETRDRRSIKDKNISSSVVGAKDTSCRSHIPPMRSVHQSTGSLRPESLNQESDNSRPSLLGEILGTLDTSQPSQIPNNRPTDPVPVTQPTDNFSEFDRWIMGVETGQRPASPLGEPAVPSPHTTSKITSAVRPALLSEKDTTESDKATHSSLPMPLLNFDGPGSSIDGKELHISDEQKSVRKSSNTDIGNTDTKPLNTNTKAKSRSSHWLSGLLPTKGSKKCHRELPPERPEKLTLSLDLGNDTTFSNVMNDLVESKTTQAEEEIELALQDNTSALSQFLIRNVPPTCNTGTSFRELPSGQKQAISALTELLHHKGISPTRPVMNNSDVEDSDTDGSELSEGGYSDDESGPDTPGGAKKQTEHEKKGVSWNLPSGQVSEADQANQATSASDMAKDEERKRREQEKEKERALLQRMLDRHRNEILKGHGAIHNWMVNSGINPDALFDEPSKPVEEARPPVNAKYRSIPNPFTAPGVEDPSQPYFGSPYGNPAGGGRLMYNSNRSGSNINTTSSFGATFTRRNYSAQALPSFPLTNLPPCPPPPNLHMAYNGAVNLHNGSPGIPFPFNDNQVPVAHDGKSDSDPNTVCSKTYVSPLLSHTNRQHMSPLHPTHTRKPYQEHNPGVSPPMEYQTSPTVSHGEPVGRHSEAENTPVMNPPDLTGPTQPNPDLSDSKSVSSVKGVSAVTDPASKLVPIAGSCEQHSSDESDVDGESSGYVDFQKKANPLARPIVMTEEPDPPAISPTETKRRFKTNFKRTSSDARTRAGVYANTFNSVGTPVALPNLILAKRKQEEEERLQAVAREEEKRKAEAIEEKTTRQQRKGDNHGNSSSESEYSDEYSDADSGSHSYESENSADEGAPAPPFGPFVPGFPYYGCYPAPPGTPGYPPSGGMMPAPGYYPVYPVMATPPGVFAMPPSRESASPTSSTVPPKGNPLGPAPRSLKDLAPPPSVTKVNSPQKPANAVRYPLDSSDDSDESEDELEEKKVAPVASSTIPHASGTVPVNGYAHPYAMTNSTHPHMVMFATGNRPPMVYPSAARLNPGHPSLLAAGSPTAASGYTAWPLSPMSPTVHHPDAVANMGYRVPGNDGQPGTSATGKELFHPGHMHSSSPHPSPIPLPYYHSPGSPTSFSYGAIPPGNFSHPTAMVDLTKEPSTPQPFHPIAPPNHGLPGPIANMRMQSGINQSYLMSGRMHGADSGGYPPTNHGFPPEKRHPSHLSPRVHGAAIHKATVVLLIIRILRDSFVHGWMAALMAIAAIGTHLNLKDVSNTVSPLVCQLSLDPEKPVSTQASKTLHGLLKLIKTEAVKMPDPVQSVQGVTLREEANDTLPKGWGRWAVSSLSRGIMALGNIMVTAKPGSETVSPKSE
ncbi:Nuclear aminoacylation-dependent tRNA export pathway component [Dispira parvispora]|uniref:Nuclear aminoacylation-dependent tRNA export pathway component n=1 Tax=Dispira parvispora TaxID=1520584 RepID=A0A9W8B0Z3_9FUNG|nr:Nuclear aminoacylation-dependent tRNA export pathway component [Dispira parvispora]